MISIISIIIGLVVIGVALYLINLIPMDSTIRSIIYVIVMVAVVFWLLQALGIVGSLGFFGI